MTPSNLCIFVGLLLIACILGMQRYSVHQQLPVAAIAGRGKSFVRGVESHIIVRNASLPTLNQTIFQSVPIAWRSNPLSFSNVSGLLVLANQTQAFLDAFREKFPDSPYPPPLIIVDLYPGYRRPYVEDRIVAWARQYNPVAAVFLGEYEEGINNELGSLDQIVLGIDTSDSKYPIVQTYWSTWYTLKPFLLNNSIINATITDRDPNPWRSLRASWWFPTWITIGISWCLFNAIFSAWNLRKYPCQRTLAVVVLWIEIVSNLMRIPFMMDPFGPWFVRISPFVREFGQLSLTPILAVHISGSIITLFFWHELVTSTDLEARAGFLTSGKWPAAVTVVIMVVVEFTTSAFRAAGYHSLLLNLNSAVYFVVLFALAGLYFYVYGLVYRFFKRSPALRGREEVLRRISIRFVLTAVTFLASLAIGCLTITRPMALAIGQSIIHFAIISVLNTGSTLTISAFVFQPGNSTASKANSSKTSGTAEHSQSMAQTPITWKGRSKQDGADVSDGDSSSPVEDAITSSSSTEEDQ